jgi:hypothetical protein
MNILINILIIKIYIFYILNRNNKMNCKLILFQNVIYFIKNLLNIIQNSKI